MYSSSDFERLFIRYKAEAMPQGESIQDFCLRNKVPYNLFHKWYKDTRHQIVPVQVEGQPEMDTQSSKEVSSSPTLERKENTEPCPIRMMIDIRMTNGIRIQQRNLTYRNLRSLIEKLEGLCWMSQEWTDFTICVIFTICAVSMNGYYPSFISSWTANHRKMKFSLSCPRTGGKSVSSAMTGARSASMRNVSVKVTGSCSYAVREMKSYTAYSGRM